MVLVLSAVLAHSILAILYLMTAMTKSVMVVSFEILHSFKRWCGKEHMADLVLTKPRNHESWKKRKILRSDLNNMK